VEYFGLGIGHSKGKLANQIWLLAEDVDAVLCGKTFARYILKNEATGKRHPAISGIMYVSLGKLSEEESPAGELALFLLGKASELKDRAVKKIAKAFSASFKEFQADKEVTKMLSLAERYEHDGFVRGEARGEARGMTIGAIKLAELIKNGFTVDEALLKLNEEQNGLPESK